MLRIQDLLDRDLILMDLRAADKAGVIRELAGLLARNNRVQDPDALAQAVLDRESQGSTGIGEGIAIPHAKSQAIDDIVVAFGRSTSGVDFQSLDGKPAYLFFLLVTPEDRPGEHLKLLARISRIMRNAALREQLLLCTLPGELQKLILDEDGKYPCIR
jgi:fructose-specific phosphotransferase system IIA component